MTVFGEQVLQVVAAIPRGQVMTYRAVAVAAGKPRAWRAVGNILKGNFDPAIPCHRVVCSDGSPGQYNRSAALKALLLRQEGAL